MNILCTFLALFLSTSHYAQEGKSTEKSNVKIGDYVELNESLRGEMYGSINFPNAELNDIVNAISKLAQKNFILDNKLKNRRVTILSPQEVTKQEAYNAFLSSLYMNGLTIVSTGKFLKIIEAKDAPRSNTRVFYGSYVPNSEEVVTLVYPVQNLNAEDMPRYIQDLLPRTGRILTYPETNALVITDTGLNLRRLISIIKSIDKPGFQPKLATIQIQYASAKEIAEMIDQILEAQQGGSTSRRRSSRSKSGAKKIQGGGVITKIVPDERTNSLVVLANGRGITELRNLVAKLDNPGAANKGNIHVYYCKNALAEELATTLNNLIDNRSSSQNSNIPGGRRSTNNRSSNLRASVRNNRNNRNQTRSSGIALDGDIKVTADKATNSLVVKSSASDFNALKLILDKLDIPRRQVYVEGTIMEISRNNSKNVSVVVNVAKEGIAQAGGFKPSTFTNFASALATPAGINGVLAGFASSQTVEINGINIPNVTAFLNAIVDSDQGQILHAPQILTSDNEEASITVTEKVPVPTATFSTESDSQQTTFEPQDVILELKITPQISEENDLVKLIVEQQIDDFTNSSTASGQINVTERKAKTTVSVRDGDTIAIGGLKKNTVSEVRSRIPLLGDLPLLGALFRGTSTEIRKSDLILFLKPTIIEANEDIHQITHNRLMDRRKLGAQEKDPPDRFKKEIHTMIHDTEDKLRKYGLNPTHDLIKDTKKKHTHAAPEPAQQLYPQATENQNLEYIDGEEFLPPPPPGEIDLPEDLPLSAETDLPPPPPPSNNAVEESIGPNEARARAFQEEEDAFSELPDLNSSSPTR